MRLVCTMAEHSNTISQSRVNARAFTIFFRMENGINCFVSHNKQGTPRRYCVCKLNIPYHGRVNIHSQVLNRVTIFYIAAVTRNTIRRAKNKRERATKRNKLSFCNIYCSRAHRWFQKESKFKAELIMIADLNTRKRFTLISGTVDRQLYILLMFPIYLVIQ